ncbi:MAG: UDP-N-acetylglucosamine 1-carboxyvinyltransferase [Elusimicrobia bacterium RIFCSPHIGHO2_02_FULL_57_9]|nr:MAG: UDP-N-acetylglucosamine 1-carboxyvinyltransferase [Elusimicrobia bacterium RIFCSPHIGHO2_02_FULL_57_9]
MDQFIIEGARPLRGSVRVSGSKNAALPILIATLLTDDPCVIDNVPVLLRDIRTTLRLLESLGKKVELRGNSVRVTSKGSLKTQAPYDLVKQMRASVLAAGPLLARFGLVRVPIPGGCAIGLRPIDIHLQGFADMGARRIADHGDIILSAPALKPRRLRFTFPSVGATENLMMAACAVSGLTVIQNAACEPEIEDLGRFLNRLGAHVSGAGTPVVKIRGTLRLKGCRHCVIPDRIEAGTFLLAAAATRGNLRLLGAEGRHLGALIDKMRSGGALIKAIAGGLQISMTGRPRAVAVDTAPYPGFPTDLQAPWMSWMCSAQGRSRVKETVFENRFLHSAELARMGAQIGVGGNNAIITGVAQLHGAPIMASDIRAGAGLLIAALAAHGRTVLQRVYHIDRGYERVEFKLRRVGARIRRVKR